VALLDGDDYWMSWEKLQRQADFLDMHPSHSMCFHKALNNVEEGKIKDCLLGPPVRKDAYDAEDLMRYCCFIPTAAMMFRKCCVDQAPDWFFRVANDWSLAVVCAMQGAVGFLDEVMSVRRAHVGGAYWGLSQSEQFEAHVRMYELFLRNLPRDYRPPIRWALSEHLYRLALAYVRTHHDAEARRAALRGAWNSLWRRDMLPRNVSLFLRLALPRVFGEVSVDRVSAAERV